MGGSGGGSVIALRLRSGPRSSKHSQECVPSQGRGVWRRARRDTKIDEATTQNPGGDTRWSQLKCSIAEGQ